MIGQNTLAFLGDTLLLLTVALSLLTYFKRFRSWKFRLASAIVAVVTLVAALLGARPVTLVLVLAMVSTAGVQIGFILLAAGRKNTSAKS